jgi:drug/metabolite transporter (DMT)-like permease
MPAQAVTWQGLAYLLVVYLIWGSTYLAIRVAVREGAGFPPFTMSALRTLVAGLALLAFTRALGHRIRPTRHETLVLALSGLALWLGGNGLVAWAEQRADSGYAAVLIGSTPIFVALLESRIDRRRPSLLLIASLLVGLAGVAVLSAPTLSRGDPLDLASVAALLGASIVWAFGTVLQRRRPVGVTPLVSSAYQMLWGGLGFLVVLLVAREPLPTPTTEAWLAWGYLVVFGSWLGFTSYIQVLRRLPTNLAMTYSYVNPVIAVLLGSALLGEALSLSTLLGVALVLAGVAGVFQDRRK